MSERSLNAVFIKPTMRRRYEVWFLKLLLADASGAWWFRYLLMNLGRDEGGCADNPRGLPVQVWATWFPKDGTPQSYIKGFSQDGLSLSKPGAAPFHLHTGSNRIEENACAGRIEVDGHTVSWDLRYRSNFALTMSNVGWIGFSRTPHSDAVFSGEIDFDGRVFRGDTLGYGLQGHNCGFRHRNSWNWAHMIALDASGNPASTFEVLEYEIGFGLKFRKALLWHGGVVYTFKKFTDYSRDRDNLQWKFKCSNPDDRATLIVTIDGSGPSLHRLPYMKTDCSDTFEVANNSFARATLHLSREGHSAQEINSSGGAVLEMGGAS